MEHLSDLNHKQKEAAIHTQGPILVVAGAGAGKTKTITHRIVNLIKTGVAPEQILAVTFTNKAAKEMRERVLASIDKNNPAPESPWYDDQLSNTPFVSTFHSLGVHLIRDNSRRLGFTRHFKILDERDSINLIKETLKDLGFDPKTQDPKRLKGIISRAKGKCIEHHDFKPARNNPAEQLVLQIWPIYEKKKNKENSLDFDDLLLKPLKLLEEHEEIRKHYQDKWRYLHVDEYQDTNEVQYRLAKILADQHKNICVVGDADQNIYSWRGANLKNLLNFERDYKDAKIILLEQNYRSTQNILEAANEIIKKNNFRPEKNLFTKNKTGEKISIYEALDESDEADFIATKILGILDFTKSRFASGLVTQPEDPSKPAFGEIAILYRANFQSRALEEAMLAYNIPYQVLGVKFFERKEVKDTLAYLRAALNRDNWSDVKRVINFPKRGIGKATLAKIISNDLDKIPARTNIKIQKFYDVLSEIEEKIFKLKTSELIKYIVKRSGLEEHLSAGDEDDKERLENIKELATLAVKYDTLEPGKGVEKLLEDAALTTDQDDLIWKKTPTLKEGGAGKNAVKLMTVHASKGLEFKSVFIAGLEEGLFPHERNKERSQMDQEEERRLFYVALTRAKEKLYLSYANFRTIFGSRQMNIASEFLSDLPEHLVEHETKE